MSLRGFGLAIAAAVMMSGGAWADPGSASNLPVPRFVSLKTSEGNARRGPSLSHRIDWVFKHPNMPLQVVAEYGHWRRVIDQDGAGGWVHYALLSGVRTVRITEDMVALRKLADPTSPVNAYAEAGVIARLGKCTDTWCQVTVEGVKGWVERGILWGLMPGEIRE